MATIYAKSTVTLMNEFEERLRAIGVDANQEIEVMSKDLEKNHQNASFVKSINESLQKLQPKCKTVLDIICGVLEIATHAFRFFGTLGEIAVIVGKVIIRILHFIWKDPKDLPSYLRKDIETEEVKAEVAGIEREFISINAYLFEPQNCIELSAGDITAMLTVIDIKQGAKLLGSIEHRIKENLLSCDRQQVNKAVEFIALYIRVSVYRQAMLWQISSILTLTNDHFVTLISVRKVIDIEHGMNKDFSKFISMNKAVFFATAEESRFPEIKLFLQKHDTNVPNLPQDFCEYPYALWPKKLARYWMTMARTPRGIVWGTSDYQQHESRVQFVFDPVKGENNYFFMKSVKWPQWYVYVQENTYLLGISKKPGPKGQWRIIKFDDDTYALSVKQWPDKFIYMEDTILNKVRRLETNDMQIEDCLWHLVTPSSRIPKT